jgi:hypothetical protein
MQAKFLQYWADIPILYSFAFILDPRAKMTGFGKVLQLLSQLNAKDYSSYLTEVRAELSTFFNHYDSKFGSVRLQRATQPGPTGKKKTSWGKIFANHSGSTYSASSLGVTMSSGSISSVSSSLSSRRTSCSALL